MSKGEWKKLAGAAARLMLAFVFVFAQTAWAGQNPETKDKAALPQKARAQQTGDKQSPGATTTKAQSNEAQGEEAENSVPEEKSSGGGRHEGIKVHGHWTIEVKNPDGSLVTHREFENSLVPASNTLLGGDSALVILLGRMATQGVWEVQLAGGTSGLCGVIFIPDGTSAPGCNIGESPVSGLSAVTNSNNLLLTPRPFPAPPVITLGGSVSVASAGTVATVYTMFITCDPTATTAACGANAVLSNRVEHLFTSAPVTPPQPVAAGQTIAVTVVISFS